MKAAKDTPPDIAGAFGDAWKLDTAAIAKKADTEIPGDMTVATWVLTTPYAHPFWSSYMVYCISLREDPKFPAPILHLPGATHEIAVLALDPNHPLMVDERPYHLTPLNFLGQFIADSDEAAAKRTEDTVRDIVNGTLNPDTDFQWQWTARFGDHCIKK